MKTARLKRVAIVLSCLIAGCSSTNWVKTGENWRDSLCEEEFGKPCPDEELADLNCQRHRHIDTWCP